MRVVNSCKLDFVARLLTLTFANLVRFRTAHCGGQPSLRIVSICSTVSEGPVVRALVHRRLPCGWFRGCRPS
jgi:hypothetical protein